VKRLQIEVELFDRGEHLRPAITLDDDGRMRFFLSEPVFGGQSVGCDDRLRLAHAIEGLARCSQGQQAGRILDPEFVSDLAPHPFRGSGEALGRARRRIFHGENFISYTQKGQPVA
jgi:hypothetical protein